LKLVGQIDIDLMTKGAADLGVSLSKNEVELYQRYVDILLEWNVRVNLTAITEPGEIVVKHFLDSLAVLQHLPKERGGSLLDIGTGAGFPGIPIKIAWPEINVVLLDSLNKRVSFLRHLITELSLQNIFALHGRAEDIGHDEQYRAKFDLVVSRAVAKLSVLAELCLPFVKEGGLFVAYKGPKAEEELQEAENSLALVGGRVSKLVKVALPGKEDDRIIVLVEKVGETPAKYPRKAGLPEKRPL
jgi:16S rRNA (guanine527-N7)-methyltransferase